MSHPCILAASPSDPFRFDGAEPLEWIEASQTSENQPAVKRFRMVAYTGGTLRVAAYSLPVVLDLAGMTAVAPVPILLNHELGEIVGHADEIDLQTTSLKVRGVISGASPAADQVLRAAAQGFPWRCSVGARPEKMEFVGEGVATKVNDKTFTGPLYVARKSTLGEVSFCAVGADRGATATVAATQRPCLENPIMEPKFREWIQAIGLDPDALRDDQTEKLRAKYDAEIKAVAVEHGAVAHVPTFDFQAIGLEYAKHEAQIEAKAAEFATKVDSAHLIEIKACGLKTAAELKAKALQEQWASVRLEAEYVKAQALYEVELLRAERPKGPAVHSSSHELCGPAIEAAFSRSCGLQSPERHYSAEVLQASDAFRGIGLQELLMIHAEGGGYHGRRRIRQDNLREVIRAAFSTNSLTTLLTTTGNKLLLEGFDQTPQSWREVAGVESVSDFKSVTAFRMSASLEYEEVGPAGEIKHGTLGQESYTLQAKTYARMAALTRQDIINDDLGALNALRNRLGIAAAIKMNKVFWTLWLATSNAGTFWTGARGNLVTSSALAEAGLNTAVAAFRDLEGPDGNMIDLEPALLLVPPALEGTARKIYVSQEQRDTTASTKFPTANIFFNRFRPVVVPELGKSAFTGYSATTWFLLADPKVMASAVMCFLNGQQSPTIESTDADFDTLGIQFRGYHDFGAAMTEYRASVKATA